MCHGGGGILAYSKSFANFNTHKEFNIIQGKIPNKSGDIKLAVFVGGKKYEGEGFPPKEGHKFKGYECTNGVTLTWNNDDWTATITTGKPTLCILEFETKIEPEIVTFLKSNSGDIKEFTHEDTEQTGLNTNIDYRYIGADPNNYISFNNELWRIIGVFNTDDGTNKYEWRLKLIRSTGMGKVALDSSNIGDWATSSLMKLLNEGNYYTKSNEYSAIGLNETSKSQISTVKWYLGGFNTTAIIPEQFYGYERGTITYSGKATNWIGKVGLMYPSDYGFATSANCSNILMGDWSNNSTCYTNDWIYKGNFISNDTTVTSTSYITTWTLSPMSHTIKALFTVYNAGFVGGYDAMDSNAFRPVVYLNSNIAIIGGNGTNDEPYILE